jgi:pentatricopeptide repeat protein
MKRLFRVAEVCVMGRGVPRKAMQNGATVRRRAIHEDFKTRGLQSMTYRSYDFAAKSFSTATVSTVESFNRKSTANLLKTPLHQWDDYMRRQATQNLAWWTQRDADPKAWETSWKLWERLVEESSGKTIDIHLFQSVLNLWRKQCASRANGIMNPRTMIQHIDDYRTNIVFHPGEEIYNMILHALGSTNDRQAPQVAERLLEQMIADDTMPRPTIITFSATMKVWVVSRHPHAPQRVQALDDRRDKLMRQGWHKLEPNAISKSIIIDAFAQAGQACQCQRLLDIWVEESRGTPGLEPPTIQTVSTVLSAWSKKGDGYRAEGLLRHMIDLHKQSILKEPPNIVSYSSVLDAWAKSKEPRAAERADAILRQLVSNSAVQPNVVAYTTVIYAWAKRGKASRAQALLDEMIERGIQPNVNTFNALLLSLTPAKMQQTLKHMASLARTHGWECSPDVVTYTTGLQVCAHAKDTRRALVVWKTMQEQGVAPDIRAYNALLLAYAKTGRAEPAEALLKDMVTMYLRAPNQKPKPETASFNTVLSAYANKGDSEGAERLVQWMSELKDSEQLDTATPNVITYTNLMNCWAKCKSSSPKTIVDRAEAIFRRSEGDKDCQPNVVSYATLCKVYSRFGMGDRAEALLRHMQTVNKVQPNATMYTQVLHAWAEQCAQTRDPEIVSQVEALVEEMMERKQFPTIASYSAVLKSIFYASITDKAERAKAVLAWMKCNGVEPNDVIKRQVISYEVSDEKNM